MKAVKAGAGKIVLMIILLAVVIGAVLWVVNHWIIHVNIRGDEIVHVEYKTKYEDEGAEAQITGTVFQFIKQPVDVSLQSDVDTSQLGTFDVLYTASKWGVTGTGHRKVIVEDTIPPEISLKTKEDYYTLPNHPYQEEGFEAFDNYDGDLTDKVKSEEKEGIVYYSVMDSSGNVAAAERKIFYDDRTPPEIIIPEETVILQAGESWEDDFDAVDDAKGEMKDLVKIDGQVDTSTPGTYTLTYTAIDDYGNTSTASRTVIVKAKTSAPQGEQDKTVYLTFDDGPGSNTDRLLDILAKYNAKATFFVTAQFQSYLGCIGREAKEGHAVGIHTYTHDFKQIYASEDAFWNDQQRMQEIIKEQTGSTTTLMRFPGGSSNTVSSFNPGVMSRLAAEAEAKGFQYFDWNVESGDAGSTTESSKVAKNIIDGISNYNISVVLCHDIKPYTIDAMEEVLKWGQANGYHFKALNANSSKAHHGINN